MKPIVDYEVAAAADPTPLKLLTPNADFEKYHQSWLENKWFPFMGFVLGAGPFWYRDVMASRPLYAGKFYSFCYFKLVKYIY